MAGADRRWRRAEDAFVTLEVRRERGALPASFLTRIALVDPALRDAVRRLDPRLGAMAAFALGWRDLDGTPRTGGAGKGLRPMLALVCAEGTGARAETAVPGAVAVELIHTFSLVHDDIMDGDDCRRHRPSAWKAYGVGPAVMAGDALLALAIETLAHAPSANASEAIGLLSSALIELVDGQAQDLDFEGRPWIGPGAVSLDEYQAMAARKTGALLGCSAAVGAVLAGAEPDVVDGLARMGRHLGLALQAVDDLLGIWGDPAVTGKPVFSDLRQRKKTVPVIAALIDGSAAGRELESLLAAGLADEDDLQRAALLVSDAGGRVVTQRLARQHVDMSLWIMRECSLAGSAAEDLAALSEFVVERAR